MLVDSGVRQRVPELLALVQAPVDPQAPVTHSKLAAAGYLPGLGPCEAVDSGRNVYVADSANDRVLMVSDVGAATVLPFTGLDAPLGVAVDRSGNVYVADANHMRVLRMPAALRE